MERSSSINSVSGSMPSSPDGIVSELVSGKIDLEVLRFGHPVKMVTSSEVGLIISLKYSATATVAIPVLAGI